MQTRVTTRFLVAQEIQSNNDVRVKIVWDSGLLGHASHVALQSEGDGQRGAGVTEQATRPARRLIPGDSCRAAGPGLSCSADTAPFPAPPPLLLPARPLLSAIFAARCASGLRGPAPVRHIRPGGCRPLAPGPPLPGRSSGRTLPTVSALSSCRTQRCTPLRGFNPCKGAAAPGRGGEAGLTGAWGRGLGCVWVPVPFAPHGVGGARDGELPLGDRGWASSSGLLTSSCPFSCVLDSGYLDSQYFVHSPVPEPWLSPLLPGNCRWWLCARECGLWLSLGGFHERGQDWEQTQKIYNCHVLLNNEGSVVATYRKTHLCDVEIPGQGPMRESNSTIPGPSLESPVSTPAGKIGLAICYDMRFPELSLALAQAGAEILTYPSAFGSVTGPAHWEVLLRARAIETQCYVVAAAQCGRHHEKRASYGHSMVVDPWGTVVARCSEGPGLCLARIDLNYLRQLRQHLPVFQHRRPDLYGNLGHPLS